MKKLILFLTMTMLLLCVFTLQGSAVSVQNDVSSGNVSPGPKLEYSYFNFTGEVYRISEAKVEVSFGRHEKLIVPGELFGPEIFITNDSGTYEFIKRDDVPYDEEYGVVGNHPYTYKHTETISVPAVLFDKPFGKLTFEVFATVTETGKARRVVTAEFLYKKLGDFVQFASSEMQFGPSEHYFTVPAELGELPYVEEAGVGAEVLGIYVDTSRENGHAAIVTGTKKIKTVSFFNAASKHRSSVHFSTRKNVYVEWQAEGKRLIYLEEGYIAGNGNWRIVDTEGVGGYMQTLASREGEHEGRVYAIDESSYVATVTYPNGHRIVLHDGNTPRVSRLAVIISLSVICTLTAVTAATVIITRRVRRTR